MKNKMPFICFYLMVSSFSFSQETQHLKDINTQIWEPFTLAFETYDYALFASIHSPDLIRVSGDGKSIRSFTAYIDGYKNRWVNAEGKQTISFRFLERIVNENFASERGIYKLTVNLNSSEEKSYYGKFHVFLKRVNGTWKLMIDYDSSELNSINEDSYNSAHPIDAFEKY